MTVTAPEWLAQLVATHPRQVLAWQDPQPPDSAEPERCRSWFEARREMCANPGRWALIYIGPHSLARSLAEDVRAGRKAFRYAGQWEVATRGRFMTSAVYVRYLGIDLYASTEALG